MKSDTNFSGVLTYAESDVLSTVTLLITIQITRVVPYVNGVAGSSRFEWSVIHAGSEVACWDGSMIRSKTRMGAIKQAKRAAREWARHQALKA